MLKVGIANGHVRGFVVFGGDSREVTLFAKHVNNDLKMKMRRPVSVCWGRAHACNFFSVIDFLADDLALQACSTQMPVQRIKRCAMQVVLEDEGGAVVADSLVVLETVYRSLERREDFFA